MATCFLSLSLYCVMKWWNTKYCGTFLRMNIWWFEVFYYTPTSRNNSRLLTASISRLISWHHHRVRSSMGKGFLQETMISSDYYYPTTFSPWDMYVEQCMLHGLIGRITAWHFSDTTNIMFFTASSRNGTIRIHFVVGCTLLYCE